MRMIAVLLMFALLLSGCGSPPEETALPQIPESTASEPETTQETTEAPTQCQTVPEDPVEALLLEMTTEEKVGQLFLARCPDANAADHISTYHLGGYILFGRDFQDRSREQVIRDLARYQGCARIPLLLAVDEEGGTVCRVSGRSAFRSRRFMAPRVLYQAGGLPRLLEEEAEKAQLLTMLGLNVNMGPVCDITTRTTAFMYERSLGQPAAVTGEFVTGTVEVYREAELGSVLKHFPGYGNSADTHTGIATDKRTLDELEASDLIPFAMGIEAGADAILVSHTVVTAFDDALPASLSPVVHSYLRQEMGFAGVILTDDLAMGAITESYGVGEAAVLAVLAGNDLLCSTDYPQQYEAVLAAVREGRISSQVLDSAVRRVLQWKQRLGLI